MLQGKRITIRRAFKKDVEHLIKWGNDQEIFLLSRNSYRMVSEVGYVDLFRLWDDSNLHFVIERNKIEEPIGFASLLQVNWITRKATLEFSIGDKSYWNGSYWFEIYAVMADYIFNYLALNVLSGSILTGNIRHLKILKFFGIEPSGLLRNDFFFRGSYQDAHIFDLTREIYHGRLENIGKKYLSERTKIE
ncbi:GNAT family N-acetyltransferase [Candidatus Peregrinibacteria bacterium]|nr:GNAT family N-acetyltransferase [Candidatus Peregrinibacteria bacterium]